MNTDLICSQVWLVGAIVHPGKDWEMLALSAAFFISAIRTYYQDVFRETL